MKDYLVKMLPRNKPKCVLCIRFVRCMRFVEPANCFELDLSCVQLNHERIAEKEKQVDEAYWQR